MYGIRIWGTIFAAILWAGVMFGPAGFVPILHSEVVKIVIPILIAIVLILAYAFRISKMVILERTVAIVWLFSLFFIYLELGGVNSPYFVTIIFPVLIESASMDSKWLARVSVVSIILFFSEGAYEFWLDGISILPPFLYNSFMYLLFIVYFNMIVRNVFGYISEGSSHGVKSFANEMTIMRRERDGFAERFLNPAQGKYTAMMKTIDEARSVNSLHLQGALLGVLYEQLYDARDEATAEGRTLLRKIEEFAAVPIKDIISEVLDEVKVLAKSEGVKIALDDIPDVNVFVAKNVCIEALRSLFENAVLYSPEGEVSIKVVREVGFARLTVMDNGIGIPDDFMQFRFVRGARAANARDLRPGRLGSGLADAQLLVSSFYGSVNIEPRTDERGVIATLLLPFSAG